MKEKTTIITSIAIKCTVSTTTIVCACEIMRVIICLSLFIQFEIVHVLVCVCVCVHLCHRMLLVAGLGTVARPLPPQQQAGRGAGRQIVHRPPRNTEKTESRCPQNDHTSTQETAVENYEESPPFGKKKPTEDRRQQSPLPARCRLSLVHARGPGSKSPGTQSPPPPQGGAVTHQRDRKPPRQPPLRERARAHPSSTGQSTQEPPLTHTVGE